MMSQAKAAMAKGDFKAALEAFEAIDKSKLEPFEAVRILVHQSRCLHALQRDDECTTKQREALQYLIDNNFLSAPLATADIYRLALELAVGARDAITVRNFIQGMMSAEAHAIADSYRVAPLLTVQDWADANGRSIQILDAAEWIEVPDVTGDNAAIRYKCKQTWHTTIPHAEIVCGWDFAMTPDGKVLHGANYSPLSITFPFMPHALNGSLNLIAHPWPEQCTVIDVDAFFLSTPERHHYGHWLADFLPRLRAWQKSGIPRRKIVISRQLPRKHRDLLARFGATADDLIECDLGSRYKFRSLQIVYAGSAAAPNPHSVKFLYHALGPHTGHTVPGEGKRLFLIRDAGTRLPANIDEVDRLFKEFDITKVNPAKLSLQEQEMLFADVEVVIGAFGTELYCLFNMRPGSTVIELIGNVEDAHVYGPTCSFLSINHGLVVCQTSETSARTSYKKDRDLIVDCDRLKAKLIASGIHRRSP